MLFTKAKSKPSDLPPITTLQGSVIESVSQYKYLGIIIDDALSLKPHIQQLLKKLKIKLGFYFRNKSCFTFEAKKRLVAATFCWIMVMFYIRMHLQNAYSLWTRSITEH